MINIRTCKEDLSKTYDNTLVKNAYMYKIASIEIRSMILAKNIIA